MSDRIQITTEDRILVLRLNRADKMNALTPTMYRNLRGALIDASTNPAIDVVLFCANGKVYCAGNDIEDFLDPNTGTHAIDFIRTLADFNKPLVAAVQGHAVGIGMTMLLHFDLVYAAPNVRFSLPFVNLGLVPEAAASLLLPTRIGHARAAAMLMLAEAITAEQACEAGLVSAICSEGSVISDAHNKALALCKKPQAALATTRMLLRGDRTAVMQCIDEEAVFFAQAKKSPDAREALQAFLDKREPVFSRKETRIVT